MSNVQVNQIIKEGLMIKRSQNKKAYTRVNYKKRFFVLTKQYLIYYDVIEESGRSVSIEYSIPIDKSNFQKAFINYIHLSILKCLNSWGCSSTVIL